MNRYSSTGVALAIIITLVLAACGTTTGNSGNSSIASVAGENSSVSEHASNLSPQQSSSQRQDTDEAMTDAVAKELFERATKEIITLSSEDPTTIVKMIFGDDIEIFYDEKSIDGEVYYETSAEYEKLRDYFSEIFTGDALNWVLSTKFAEIEGRLYCSPAGGSTGWSIENLSILQVDQIADSYFYTASFSELGSTTTCKFTVVKTDDGYRILNVDYIPDSLRK